MGILVFTVSMSLLIALVLHRALRRAGLPFIAEVFSVAVALGAMSSLISPRPWLFSILFFTVELFILFHVRRTDKIAPLLALPPLFVLWANLHIQFIYGLAVLGLFLVEVLLSQLPSFSLYPRHRPNISLGRVSFLLLACLVATLITPYHFRLYIPIFEVHRADGSFSVDLGAPPSILSSSHGLAGHRAHDWSGLCSRLAEKLASFSNSLAFDGNFSRV